MRIPVVDDELPWSKASSLILKTKDMTWIAAMTEQLL